MQTTTTLILKQSEQQQKRTAPQWFSIMSLKSKVLVAVEATALLVMFCSLWNSWTKFRVSEINYFLLFWQLPEAMEMTTMARVFFITIPLSSPYNENYQYCVIWRNFDLSNIISKHMTKYSHKGTYYHSVNNPTLSIKQMRKNALHRITSFHWEF